MHKNRQVKEQGVIPIGTCSLEKVISYRSLAKEHPWAEHLTSLPKRGVGTPLSISISNNERVLTTTDCP